VKMKQTFIFVHLLSIINKQFCCKELISNTVGLITKKVSKFFLAKIYIFYAGASFLTGDMLIIFLPMF
jgi:hypothetical protein